MISTCKVYVLSLADAPSPQSYSLEHKMYKSNQCHQFGASRDKYAKVYLKEHPAPDTSIPGPGAYSAKFNSVEKMQNQGIQMKSRYHHGSIFVDYTKANPGPGQYDPVKCMNANKDGVTVYYRYKSPVIPSIGKSGNRFYDPKSRELEKVPGPGSYAEG